MDVATGKPSAEERRAVRHHLIDVVDPDDRYHAARFRRDAAALVDEVRRRGALPAVVGGTGLYIRALLRGLDPAPPADTEFRQALAAVAAADGRVALHARLAATAPAVASRLHPNDHVRVVRALERVRAGSTLGADQACWASGSAEYDVCYVGLTLARDVLRARLRARAEAMVRAGLHEEVRALLRRGHAPTLPALMGIGYREFVRVVQGGLPPATALAEMQRDTVRYAKRQRTWFEREPELEWIDVETAGGPEGVAMMVEARLQQRGMIP
jgi:tRNA dimethylallyltransferase